MTVVDDRPRGDDRIHVHDDFLGDLDLLLDADPSRCGDRAAAGIEMARAEQDLDAEMRLTYYLAYAQHLLGQDALALSAAARCEELARELDEPVWQSRALACRGLVHHEIGDDEDAVDLLRRAVALRREAKDAAGTAEVLTSLGSVYTGMVQFAPEAAQTLTEARRTWLAAGDPDRASTALAHLAANLVATSARIARTNRRGAMAAARRAMAVAQQAVDEADAAGLSRTSIDARLAVIGSLLIAGDLDKAGTVLATTWAMQERFPAPRQLLALRRARATWLVETGRYPEALTEIECGLQMCDALGRPTEHIELLRTRSDAYERSGDLASALAALHEVHDRTVELSEAFAARRAVLLSSRLDLERAQRAAETERRRSHALEERNALLDYEANHDALTGLYNRRALDLAMTERVADTERPMVVALLDIDHFKRVNDECSHQVGDRVLARLGTVLGSSLRDLDLSARYGGEEFALILDGAELDIAHKVCDRIRASVAALTWDDAVPGGRITVSIGAAQRLPGSTVAEMLARADAALYRAKATGRNRVCLAT